MHIDERNYTQAINIVEEKIKPVKEKVVLLKQYSTQLLDSDSKINSQAMGKE